MFFSGAEIVAELLSASVSDLLPSSMAVGAVEAVLAALLASSELPEDAVFVVFVVVEVVVSEVVAAVAVVEVVVVDSASEAELLLRFLLTTKLVPRP